MPEAVKSRSFVISVRDLGESDKIVTLFTRSHGKKRAVAKGAKRSIKRFLNALEPFCLLDVSLIPPRRRDGLNLLEGCTIVDPFEGLRGDYNRFLSACLACELIDAWVRQEDPHPGLFELLGWLMNGLSSGGSPGRLTLIFATRLLSQTGYGSDFRSCPRCGSPLSGRALRLSPDLGGLLCRGCDSGTGSEKGMYFSAGAARSLAFFQDSPLSRVDRLKVGPEAMDECWEILRRIHEHHLQKPPQSFKLINRIKKGFFHGEAAAEADAVSRAKA